MVSPRDALAERLFPPRAQAVVAAAVAAGLVALAGWYVASAAGLVDHDTAPRVPLSFTVDVNAADEVELAQLPGVGPALARRIVDRRSVAGRFASADDLLAVPGIGPATLARLHPHLRGFGGAEPPPREPAR